MNSTLPVAHLSHDAIDAFVANVASLCERVAASRSDEPAGEVTFTDEWERKQIARKLHHN